MCWLADSSSKVIAKAQQISFLASTEMCFLSWVTCDICPWKSQYGAHLNLSRGQQRLQRSEGLWGQRISDSQHGLYCWICRGNNRPHILAGDIYVDQSTVICLFFVCWPSTTAYRKNTVLAERWNQLISIQWCVIDQMSFNMVQQKILNC